MSFRDRVIEGRRLFLLRRIVEMNGEANEGMLHIFAKDAGVGDPSRDDLRCDLDHLRQMGCVTERWDSDMRIAILTERGEDVAHGRAAAEGVQRSRWDRRQQS